MKNYILFFSILGLLTGSIVFAQMAPSVNPEILKTELGCASVSSCSAVFEEAFNSGNIAMVQRFTDFGLRNKLYSKGEENIVKTAPIGIIVAKANEITECGNDTLCIVQRAQELIATANKDQNLSKAINQSEFTRTTEAIITLNKSAQKTGITLEKCIDGESLSDDEEIACSKLLRAAAKRSKTIVAAIPDVNLRLQVAQRTENTDALASYIAQNGCTQLYPEIKTMDQCGEKLQNAFASENQDSIKEFRTLAVNAGPEYARQFGEMEQNYNKKLNQYIKTELPSTEYVLAGDAMVPVKDIYYPPEGKRDSNYHISLPYDNYYPYNATGGQSMMAGCKNKYQNNPEKLEFCIKMAEEMEQSRGEIGIYPPPPNDYRCPATALMYPTPGCYYSSTEKTFYPFNGIQCSIPKLICEKYPQPPIKIPPICPMMPIRGESGCYMESTPDGCGKELCLKDPGYDPSRANSKPELIYCPSVMPRICDAGENPIPNRCGSSCLKAYVPGIIPVTSYLECPGLPADVARDMDQSGTGTPITDPARMQRMKEFASVAAKCVKTGLPSTPPSPAGQREQIWNTYGLRSWVRTDADQARIDRLKENCKNVPQYADVWTGGAGNMISLDFGMPDPAKCSVYAVSPPPTPNPVPGTAITYPYTFIATGKVLNSRSEMEGYCGTMAPGSGWPGTTVYARAQAECVDKGFVWGNAYTPPYPGSGSTGTNHTWNFRDGSIKYSSILSRTDAEYTNFIASKDAEARTGYFNGWKPGGGNQSLWQEFGIPEISITSPTGTQPPYPTPYPGIGTSSCTSAEITAFQNGGVSPASDCHYMDSNIPYAGGMSACLKNGVVSRDRTNCPSLSMAGNYSGTYTGAAGSCGPGYTGTAPNCVLSSGGLLSPCLSDRPYRWSGDATGRCITAAECSQGQGTLSGTMCISPSSNVSAQSGCASAGGTWNASINYCQMPGMTTPPPTGTYTSCDKFKSRFPDAHAMSDQTICLVNAMAGFVNINDDPATAVVTNCTGPGQPKSDCTGGSTSYIPPPTGTYTTPVSTTCSSGQYWNGSSCVSSTCPSGYTGTPPNCTVTSTGTYTTPTSCPTDYYLSGSTCVPSPTGTASGTCPSGYTGTPPNCTVTSTGTYTTSVATTCSSGQYWNGSSCVTGTCPYGGTYPNCTTASSDSTMTMTPDQGCKQTYGSAASWNGSKCIGGTSPTASIINALRLWFSR